MRRLVDLQVAWTMGASARRRGWRSAQPEQQNEGWMRVANEVAPQEKQIEASAGLEESDFRLVSENGFGNGYNVYTHSMAWFENNLYVGTTMGAMQGMKNFVPPPNLKPWPVISSTDPYDYDRRAEIWQYDVALNRWQRVYQSPWVEGLDGRPVPRYMGLRGMTEYQGRRDRKPCLYVTSWATFKSVAPPDLLRTEDGKNFEVMPRLPFSSAVRSFRSLQKFRGYVHTTPTGSNQKGVVQENMSSEATIYATDDIEGQKWIATSEHGFSDRGNASIFEMGVFNGHLYAGAANGRGFQLWKTDGGDAPPYRWERVIDRGAYRGPFNQGIACMQEFKGALYIGGGIGNGGYHRSLALGPAAGEVIRVYPDDTWDLVVGSPRMTPQGLKVPLSGFAAGFDNMYMGYVWRMVVHDGWLYAGTFSWINTFPFNPSEVWPEDVLRTTNLWDLQTLLDKYGGCALWRTFDGVCWEPVTLNGFGNKYNWGVRNFASTPHGLFVGTANVYGPTLAVQRGSKWKYVDNPRGGCEVWLGKPRRAEQHS
jgi:hypothetical protein